jgi:hypothetical protein
VIFATPSNDRNWRLSARVSLIHCCARLRFRSHVESGAFSLLSMSSPFDDGLKMAVISLARFQSSALLPRGQNDRYPGFNCRSWPPAYGRGRPVAVTRVAAPAMAAFRALTDIVCAESSVACRPEPPFVNRCRYARSLLADSTGECNTLKTAPAVGVLQMKQRRRIYYSEKQKALMWEPWRVSARIVWTRFWDSGGLFKHPCLTGFEG